MLLQTKKIKYRLKSKKIRETMFFNVLKASECISTSKKKAPTIKLFDFRTASPSLTAISLRSSLSDWHVLHCFCNDEMAYFPWLYKLNCYPFYCLAMKTICQTTLHEEILIGSRIFSKFYSHCSYALTHFFQSLFVWNFSLWVAFLHCFR